MGSFVYLYLCFTVWINFVVLFCLVDLFWFCFLASFLVLDWCIAVDCLCFELVMLCYVCYVFVVWVWFSGGGFVIACGFLLFVWVILIFVNSVDFV